MVYRILRDPLFAFMLAGGVLFWWSSQQATNLERQIIVDQPTLLNYIRQQSQNFEPGNAEARLARASPAEVETLANAYVREEALYREAIALGFDHSDYVLKRRLVQKAEFYATGFGAARTDSQPDAARRYYEENRANYTEGARFTFTHIYFAHSADALANANRTLALVQHPAFDVNRVSGYGDRFPYHRNYVDRAPEFIAGHFGEEFLDQLTVLASNEHIWQGPLNSKLGVHLIRMIRHEAQHLPKFDDIAQRVERDLQHHQMRTRAEAAVSTIIDRYDVTIDLEAKNEVEL